MSERNSKRKKSLMLKAVKLLVGKLLHCSRLQTEKKYLWKQPEFFSRSTFLCFVLKIVLIIMSFCEAWKCDFKLLWLFYIQATILKQGMPGFIFESNRGTQHTFSSQTQLGMDFVKAGTIKATSTQKTKEVISWLLNDR